MWSEFARSRVTQHGTELTKNIKIKDQTDAEMCPPSVSRKHLIKNVV